MTPQQISARIYRESKHYSYKSQSDSEPLRLLVLASDDPQQDYLLALLAQNFNVLAAVIEPGKQQHQRLLKKAKYADYWYRYWHKQRQKFSGRAAYRRDYFSALISNHKVNKEVVDWIGDQKTIDIIQQQQPDVTIVCGTMLIPKAVINAAGFIINVHGGYLPDYRGNHCIFFAYYQKNYAKIAASLHLVTPELDAGEIIAVIQPPIYPHDNDEHLYCRALHHAMLDLVTHLTNFAAGEKLTVLKSEKTSKPVYRHRSRKPWMDINLWLRRKFGLHKIPHIPTKNSSNG